MPARLVERGAIALELSGFPLNPGSSPLEFGASLVTLSQPVRHRFLVALRSRIVRLGRMQVSRDGVSSAGHTKSVDASRFFQRRRTGKGRRRVSRGPRSPRSSTSHDAGR